jgi:hypothetical protein
MQSAGTAQGSGSDSALCLGAPPTTVPLPDSTTSRQGPDGISVASMDCGSGGGDECGGGVCSSEGSGSGGGDVLSSMAEPYAAQAGALRRRLRAEGFQTLS